MMDRISYEHFWLFLAKRVSDVLRGSRDNHLRFVWCDGIVRPEHPLSPVREEALLRTTAYVVEGQDRYCEYDATIRFTPRASELWRRGKWGDALPHPDTTGWLTISKDERTLEIRL